MVILLLIHTRVTIVLHWAILTVFWKIQTFVSRPSKIAFVYIEPWSLQWLTSNLHCLYAACVLAVVEEEPRLTLQALDETIRVQQLLDDTGLPDAVVHMVCGAVGCCVGQDTGRGQARHDGAALEGKDGWVLDRRLVGLQGNREN